MTHYQLFEKGRVQRLQGAAEIHVLAGEIWLTIEGDPRDYVLREGQKQLVPIEGCTVIEALSTSQVVFSDGPLFDTKSLSLGLRAPIRQEVPPRGFSHSTKSRNA